METGFHLDSRTSQIIAEGRPSRNHAIETQCLPGLLPKDFVVRRFQIHETPAVQMGWLKSSISKAREAIYNLPSPI